MAFLSNYYAMTRETPSQNSHIPTWRAPDLRRAVPWAIALVLLTSCSEKKSVPIVGNVPLTPGPAAEPATNVLGVRPAAPTNDTSSSTAPAKSDMNPEQQSTAMPMPGQANDHSVLEPKPSQKPANR
jgi:hypothetical protein